ncbi:hypothetical protein GCM10009827_083960 [Dactylosporangium maewongense]|uniref:Uncharacterized protein n=1 Tax=Dactylosporangium maewongense TaxID=634393 RepID=A0ABN2C0B5_9ACTN
MTLAVDHLAPKLDTQPRPCPSGVAWCVDHVDDATEQVTSHLGADRVQRLDRDTLNGKPVDEPIAVTVARHDSRGVAGEPLVCITSHAFSMSLLVAGDGLAPTSARELAVALLAAAAEATGFKRADDLRIGDRIVLDGQVHEVVFLMIDACYHDVDVRCCEGTVQIHTDLSEAVDESDPAVTCEAGDLVQMEAAS